MAERMAPGDYNQLHHFVSDGIWDERPLELEVASQADALIDGADAILIIADATLPKKVRRSVAACSQWRRNKLVFCEFRLLCNRFD